MSSDYASLAACLRGAGIGGGGPVSLPTAVRTALNLPTLNAATTIVGSDGSTGPLTNYVTIFDGIGANQNLLRIVFGKRPALAPNTVVYPTLPVTDDGSTGSGFLKLITFPKGFITVGDVFPMLPVFVGVAGDTYTITTPVMSMGSAAAATDATLTSTEADIYPSTAVNQLTYSSGLEVIGSVVAGDTNAHRTGIFTGNPNFTQTLLVDNTGGTAISTGTLTTVVTGSTVVASLQNDISTLAAAINSIRTLTNGGRSYKYDGTTTALSVYLNFGVNSDPTAASTITLGYQSSANAFAVTPGFIDIWYNFAQGVSSTAVFATRPPVHGAGGG